MPPEKKRNLCLHFALFLICYVAFGQTEAPIKGTIVTAQNEPLEYVSVALLHPNDSTMINFTTTDSKGDFKILENSRDSLLIQFFFTGFIAQFKNIVYEHTTLDLGKIILEEDIGQLDEVTISAVVPIQIKKDTVAYNTDAFKVDSDDNIEELLKKLPGMEIDSEGAIVAQGNEVTKIYVDGKEFFGGDPAVVLKNLSADVIAKVEVIDKKSDESELTGVSDGNKQVVLNFSLKKNKQNRGFGKASAGIGLDNRYFGNLNYNRFSPKTQFSAVAKFNNINVTGSNIRDFLQNANGLGDDSDEEEEAVKTKNLAGFLTTETAGVHVGHEFQKRESFNADYTFNASVNDGVSHTKRTTFSGVNKFDSEIENQYDNSTENHKINFNYINQANKTHSFFIKGGYNSNLRETMSDRRTEFFDEDASLKNLNLSNFWNDMDKNSGNIKFTYYKKLNDQGRNFNAGLLLNHSELDRFNEQRTHIVRNVGDDNESIRDIETSRDELIHDKGLTFNLKYSEPLGNNHFVKFETISSIRTIDEDISQTRNTITETDDFNLFEYEYLHKELNLRSKLAYSYNIEKLNIYAGVELQDVSRAFGELEVETLKRNDLFLNPQFNAQYIPKAGRKYRFNYNRSIRNPSTYQSSSVINDLIPSSIRKGNPDLEPEQNDVFLFKANIHDYSSSLSLYGSIRYQYTSNAIISTIAFQEENIYWRTRSFDNNGYKNNIRTSFSLSKKIDGLGIRYTLKNANSYNTYNSIVSIREEGRNVPILNAVRAENYSGSLSFENFNKNVFDAKIGASYKINKTHFSVVHDLNREFATQRYYGLIDYDLTNKINLNTQFDYIVFSDTKFNSNQSLPLWNAAVSYAFTKKKNNIVKLLLIDILDKNVDIRRRSTINYIEETISESLGRYVVLSYTYRLNNGKKKKKKSRKK